MSGATRVWNDATSGTIFGEGIQENLPWGQYDYKNSVSYGDYDNPYVIGVTTIWFRGKKIYEYDIMFDTDYFPGIIDLETVALHEFGHAAGLGDLYDAECQGEVMYGYLDEGETRNELGSGDITGIQALYN